MNIAQENDTLVKDFKDFIKDGTLSASVYKGKITVIESATDGVLFEGAYDEFWVWSDAYCLTDSVEDADEALVMWNDE